MQGFSRDETMDMLNDLGGSIIYTVESSGTQITGSYGIYNPSTELYDDNSSADRCEFVLLKETTDNDDIVGIPRPVRNDIIVYTDPDDGEVITAWVDEVIGSDTHIWRVLARKQ